MTTCIYHGGCPDGLTAAYLVVLRHKPLPVRLIEGTYGDPPPDDIGGDDVFVVDFSYPADQMLDMADRARTVTVFDHHQSAQQALAGLEHPSLTVVFDMDRSGAGITWDELFGGHRPALVDHIEDRDLWRFALDGTHEVFAAATSRPMTIDAWEEVFATGVPALIAEGAAINRYRRQLIEAAVRGATTGVIGGHTVPTANCPYAIGSDVASELARGRPFAAYWFDAEGERRWGLRSAPDGLDVAVIAEQYGGGGHKHASGFRTAAAAIEAVAA